MARRWLPACLILTLLVALGGAAKALPTTDEIQSLADAGKYQDALKAIAQVMASESDSGPSAARYGLLMLRGECLLQLKQGVEAARAFKAAKAQAPNAKDRATAAATALLIERSANLSYRPQATAAKLPPKPAGAANLPDPPAAGTPIDIVDKQQRKAAIVGLFYDELATDAPRVKTAKAAKTVPPILGLAGALAMLRDVETAATGGEAYSREMAKELSGHAHELMAGALATMTKQVEEITRSANQSVAVDVPTVTGTGTRQRTVTRKEYRKRGLNGGESSTLNGIISTCKEYSDASKALTTALETDSQSFGPLVSQAESLSEKATATLKADYTRTSAKPIK